MGAITFKTLLPALVTAGVTLVLMWIAAALISRGVGRLARAMTAEARWPDVEAWAARLNLFLRRTIQLVALLAAAVILLEGLGVHGTPRLTTDAILRWVLGPGLRITLTLGGAYVLARAVQFFIDRLEDLLVTAERATVSAGERRKRIRTVARLLTVTADVLIFGVAVLIVLRQVGVDITPILTGAGIAGLAVGFGAQNLVRDVISGFFLILEDQIRVGDVASINGKSGLVEAIRLRTIVLRALDGTVHIIPNGAITELSNMTKDFSYALIDVGVAYKEDVDDVAAVLREVGRDLRSDPTLAPLILDDLEVLGLDAFADSAVVIKIRMKTVPIQQWAVGRELRRRIKRAFDARGIEIPFPHVSVYAGEASKPFRVETAATQA